MEKINRAAIITALSIYSSRVSACIALLDKDGRPNIAGLGKAEGRLMGGKGVLDIDTLCRAMRDSIGIAQEEAGVKTSRAFVSLSGGHMRSEKSRGMISLGQRGGEISEKHVRDVLKVADTIPVNVENEVIHSIPQDFTVDGQKGIKNPLELFGVKLEAETLLITSHVPFLQNVVKCLNMSGLELEGFVFSGLAASRSLLSPEECENKGIILIEIDNNFTALSVFFDNLLKGIYVEEKSVVSDGVLGILKNKSNEIRCSKPISKIVLSGGGLVHEDFIEKVNSAFGVPSLMGYARNVRGRAKDINNPAYMTSIGLALYGMETKKEKAGLKKGGIAILHKATKKLTSFLNDYF